jgi:disulfide bond formation protein DsbB
MLSAISGRSGNALGFLACAGLMGYALYAQHVLGLAPCPLCIFQRVATIAVGVLITIAALGGVLISARHIWIQAQPPGTVAACGADLDYLLEIMPVTQVVTKVLTGSGECGKVDWMFLGLSMPWWVAISLGVLGLWALVVNFRKSA